MRSLTWFIILCVALSMTKKLKDNDLLSAMLIINTTADVIHDTDQRMSKMYYIRQDNYKTAPFEVGYLTCVLQEKYRKMVDKYNTSVFMKRNLYLMEHVIYLEEIEKHYWQIGHISNMLHEVERKYKITSSLYDRYDDSKTSPGLFIDPVPIRKIRKKKPKFNMAKFWKTRQTGSTTKVTQKFWDMDYGWEIDYMW